MRIARSGARAGTHKGMAGTAIGENRSGLRMPLPAIELAGAGDVERASAGGGWRRKDRLEVQLIEVAAVGDDVLERALAASATARVDGARELLTGAGGVGELGISPHTGQCVVVLGLEGHVGAGAFVRDRGRHSPRALWLAAAGGIERDAGGEGAGQRDLRGAGDRLLG